MSDSSLQTSPLQLIHRPLTQAEATRLHEELKTTANILGYTIPELLRFSDVLIAEAEDMEGNPVFAGVCINKDLLFQWTDIAVLYVLPEFRGRGIGGKLFTAAFASVRERGRHIYALSRSPEAIRLMERCGMKISRTVWRAPLAVYIHQDCHMMSLYRLREARRKSRMRKKDGGSFVTGTYRARPMASN